MQFQYTRTKEVSEHRGGGGKGSLLSQVMIQQETEDDVVSTYYL